MGGVCAQICVERELGSTVAITPIVVEAWISSWWNDWSHKDRNCLGCLVAPPTISPKIIKNLDASFCGLNPDDLSPSKLHAKPARKKAMNKKKTKNSQAESSSQGDASSGPQ
jgi:hypothetical protein